MISPISFTKKLKDYNLENTLRIQSNNNTLEVITTMRESVYSNEERLVGHLFGFHSIPKSTTTTSYKNLSD